MNLVPVNVPVPVPENSKARLLQIISKKSQRCKRKSCNFGHAHGHVYGHGLVLDTLFFAKRRTIHRNTHCIQAIVYIDASTCNC
jgi:hypothetical protein